MSTAFDFPRFLEDSRQTLLDPRGFFSSLPLSGGLGDPLLRAALFGLAAGLVNLLWGLFGLGQGRMMMAYGGMGFGGLVAMPVMALLGLFVGGGVFWLAARLCGADPRYEAALRVAAALQVLLPVRAAFNLFHAASRGLGLTLGLALCLFGAWLGYNALVFAFRVEEKKARIAAIVLAALSLPGLFG